MDSIVETAGFISTYSAQYCSTIEFCNENKQLETSRIVIASSFKFNTTITKLP